MNTRKIFVYEVLQSYMIFHLRKTQNHNISSKEYERHIEKEKNHFRQDLYGDNLLETVNSALDYIIAHFKNTKVKKQTGLTINEHIMQQIHKKRNSGQPVKILSLGCGPGGVEIRLAKNFKIDYFMDCIDINEKMLELGRKKSKSLDLKLNFVQQDINNLKLDTEEYDVVFAHASLHHMINHEHIAQEVKKSLKPDGNFIVHEPIPRNGQLMWDETKKIANEIWSLIPQKYKYDCINEKRKDKFFKELPNKDLSESGFECIRSQDIYPILKENFNITTEVFGTSFARRFFNKRFGCNYDLENPVDKAIIDLIIKLDEEYTVTHNLKPENVFLIMDKN